MNIITSSCLGGFIYRDILKEEYQNPFIWSSIRYNDFINLIKNYDTINFKNIKIQSIDNKIFLIIDNFIKIEYPHIHFSKTDNKPRYERNNWGVVFYNKPSEYILEKYNTRLKRMKEKPIIIFYDKECSQLEIDEIVNICNNKQYKCLLFTKHNVIENSFIKKIDFITNAKYWNEDLFNKHEKDIKMFLNKEEL